MHENILSSLTAFLFAYSNDLHTKIMIKFFINIFFYNTHVNYLPIMYVLFNLDGKTLFSFFCIHLPFLIFIDMKNSITLLLFLFAFSLLTTASGDEFPVATDNFSQNTPMVVFDGEDYFTVYIDRRGEQYSFYSRFISPDGDVGPEQLTVPEHPVMSFMPGLAMGDDNFLFTWSRQRGVWDWDRDGMARILNLDGSPASGTIQVSGPETQDSPAFMRVAYGGDHYLVIWQDGLPNQGARIMGQFVCATDYNLAGSNFIIRPDELDAGVSQIYPDILFDGNHYLVVWDDDRSGERSIYGMFLDTDGHPAGDDFVISDNPDRQMLVRTAYNGQHYMAAWADRRHGSKSSVYGQIFDHEGNHLGEEISISILQNNQERSWPRIGTNGNQFLVAWEQQLLTKEKSEPTAWQTARDLAAGMDYRQSVVWYEVHGRVINSNGTYYTDEMPIGVAAYHQQNPEIAGHDDQFLVLWQDSRVNNQYSDVYGRFVDAEPPTELPEPQNLSGTFTGEMIELEWEAPASAKDIDFLFYHVYKDNTLLADEVTDTFFEDDDFEQDTSYTYHVTAAYNQGESDPSNEVTVEIPVLYVNVQFYVHETEELGEDPVEGALVWLEQDEAYTNEHGIALFEAVAAHQELAWQVSHEHYFTEEGELDIAAEDKEIVVVLTLDDTSVHDLAESGEVSISPNPATDILIVESKLPIHSLSLYDMMGSKIKESVAEGKSEKLHLSGLPQGAYLLHITLSNGQVIIKKVLKRAI